MYVKQTETLSIAQWSMKNLRGSNPNINGSGASFGFSFFSWFHVEKEKGKKPEEEKKKLTFYSQQLKKKYKILGFGQKLKMKA